MYIHILLYGILITLNYLREFRGLGESTGMNLKIMMSGLK
jgi:hypothetical protein